MLCVCERMKIAGLLVDDDDEEEDREKYFTQGFFPHSLTPR